MTRPRVIATWKFGEAACRAAMEVLEGGGCALDGVERAANVTEEDPEVTCVGLGSIPNSEGVIELDAAIMDGPTHRAGAVAAITGIRRPTSVARLVMERTRQTHAASLCSTAGGTRTSIQITPGAVTRHGFGRRRRLRCRILTIPPRMTRSGSARWT